MISTLGELVVTVSASAEMSLVMKATLAAAIGLLAARAARQSRASVRHVILASTFVVLLALPLAAAVLPGVTVVIPVSAARSTPVATAPSSGARTAPPIGATEAAAPTAVRPSWTVTPASMLRIAWMLGVISFSISLGAALLRVRQLRRNALPSLDARDTVRRLARQTGLRRPVDVLVHEDVAAPMTCGLRHPAIILPPDAAGWSESALRCALVHELEHIRRGDWWLHLAARAACAAYWFHPLVWVAYRQLSLEAERACDDAVLERDERTQYAEQLVSLARRMAGAARQPALAMANRSDLSRRISAVLDQRQPRGRAGILRPAAVAVAAAAIVIALAPARAVGAAGAARPSTPENRASLRAGLTIGDISLTNDAQQAPRISRLHSRLDLALLEAAEDGDINGIRELLDAGANINAEVDGDGSPLIVAAREGHIAAVTFLLDRGADPNLGVSGDGSALIMAAREGHTNIVVLLLDRGASIEQVVDGDENALIQASGAGRLAVVKLLVARGANVNARVWVAEQYGGGIRGGIPGGIPGGIVGGVPGGAREALSAEALAKAGGWRTPLSMAQRGGHRDVVAFLLSAGAVE